jgi:hypothetical protein
MLEDHPVLKDRLLATGVFSGIAIAAVAGFEMIISGGFDFLMPGAEVREVAPSAYVTVMEVPWSPQGRVIPLSSNEPLFAEDLAPASAEDLAGGHEDAAAPQGRYPERTQEDIYADVAALYEDAAAEPAQYETAEYEPDMWADEQSADASVY